MYNDDMKGGGQSGDPKYLFYLSEMLIWENCIIGENKPLVIALTT